MAEPLSNGSRLPVDPALARSAIDAMIKLLCQFGDGRTKEPAWQEAKEAAKALHLELAAAEFDARLPARPSRSGGEPLALAVRGEAG